LVAGKATAVANANMALVKYWGNQNQALRLPANSSLSMNLAGLTSTTTVAFDQTLDEDQAWLDGVLLDGPPRRRVVEHVDRVRRLASWSCSARVASNNSFPSGAGLASSASGFAALTVAAAAAAGLELTQPQLSALARLGSGSASRSIPEGFVEWHPAARHEDSFGVSIAPPEHWALCDVIAIVAEEHKLVGSSSGHALADTSPFQRERVATTPGRFNECKDALLTRDFGRLAPVVELEALAMHAVMLTSAPPLVYWTAATLDLIKAVPLWREGGLPVAFTIDAGPNVHCICLHQAADEVERRLRSIPGVEQVMRATPGGPATLVDHHLF
jgi:diphosphomevalonate decarboxylase